MEIDTYTVQMRAENWDGILEAARTGDESLAAEQLQKLRESRARIFNEMAKARGDQRREALREALNESRSAEADLTAALQAIRDDRHAEHMAKIAEVSNTIAGHAERTARGLKVWTAVLAFATIGLVIATVVLIIVTAMDR
jgi:CHASE3 domain sensor protein